jgi:hypothetical protein
MKKPPVKKPPVKKPPVEEALVAKENQMVRDSHAVSIEDHRARVVGVPTLKTTGLVFREAGSEPFPGQTPDSRRSWVRRLGSALPTAHRI